MKNLSIFAIQDFVLLSPYHPRLPIQEIWLCYSYLGDIQVSMANLPKLSLLTLPLGGSMALVDECSNVQPCAICTSIGFIFCGTIVALDVLFQLDTVKYDDISHNQHIQ
ncbi:hypothetical protein AMTR_s00070p00145920, partial [Amborella trichopoda]